MGQHSITLFARCTIAATTQASLNSGQCATISSGIAHVRETHAKNIFLSTDKLCEILCCLQAEQKLQSHRRQWLGSESLHKCLQEMLQDHCIRKHHGTVPPDQNMVRSLLPICNLMLHIAFLGLFLHLSAPYAICKYQIYFNLMRSNVPYFKTLNYNNSLFVRSFMTQWKSLCWCPSVSDSWIPAALPTEISHSFWV